MPRTRSLKWSELKIGIMAVVALLIAAALIVALGGEGGFFWQRYNLKVKFSNAGGVQQGSPVRVSRRHGRVRHGHSSSSVPKSTWSSSCATTCRSGSGPRRGRPSDRCRCSAKAPSTSTPARRVEPIPAWGYVPSDAPPPQLADVTAQANKGIAEITALMQDIRAGKGTVGKLMTDEQLYVELRQFISASRDVTEGSTKGKGTLGQLLNNPESARQLEASLKNLTAITDKINAGSGQHRPTDERPSAGEKPE